MKGGYLKGYKIISLWKNGTGKMFRVHRLVAAAFIPNPENKPCIDHIDGDRANDHADNLRWVTVKENQNNPITKSKWIGKKAKPHHEKAVEQIKNGIVVNVFVSIQEAARKGNFSATAICNNLNFRQQTKPVFLHLFRADFRFAGVSPFPGMFVPV